MGERDSEEQRVLHEQRKEVAEQIAAQLGEAEAEPRKTIYRAVKKLGRDQAQLFVQKALEIESAGGLMVPDQSRRRTIGGIFFFLIKTEVPAEVTRHIFPRRLPPHLKKKTLPQESGEAKEMTPPAAPEAKPEVPSFTWEDRLEVVAELASSERGATAVKVTLIGRPGRIVERGQCVITTMQQQAKLPALPKGLPTPKPGQAEQTLYSVYISAKQWKGVAAAINDPEDVLIIEGWQMLDKQTESIAVYAMNTTTKKLQAAKRPSQQQKT
jgi:hypothetical protein